MGFFQLMSQILHEILSLKNLQSEESNPIPVPVVRSMN